MFLKKYLKKTLEKRTVKDVWQFVLISVGYAGHLCDAVHPSGGPDEVPQQPEQAPRRRRQAGPPEQAPRRRRQAGHRIMYPALMIDIRIRIRLTTEKSVSQKKLNLLIQGIRSYYVSKK